MSVKKQSWSSEMLTDMFKQASKNNPLDSDSYNCLSKLEKANQIIIDKTLRGWGDYFDKTEFDKTSYCQEPNYYLRTQDWRGKTIKGLDDICPDAFCLFWEAWGMSEYYMNLSMERFIEILPENNEEFEFGVTILCPTKMSEGTFPKPILDIPYEQMNWGNTDILSEEDWEKLEEYDILEYGDLIWNECSYYDAASIINVFEDIDEELEWWNGEDGVLSKVEEMFNDENYQLQTMMLIFEINRIMTTTKLSLKQRSQKVIKMVEKYQNLYENMTYDLEIA